MGQHQQVTRDTVIATDSERPHVHRLRGHDEPGSNGRRADPGIRPFTVF